MEVKGLRAARYVVRMHEPGRTQCQLQHILGPIISPELILVVKAVEI